MAELDIIFSGTTAHASTVHRAAREGRIIKIIQGVYSTDVHGKAEDVIRRNWKTIVAHKYPGALLSHRSALEFQPSPNGMLYFTYDRDQVIRWPGLSLKFAKGPAKGESDRELFPGLPVSDQERALLENLMPARISGGERRTVDRTVIETRLMKILDAHGEAGLNALRDRARIRSDELGLIKEFHQLDAIIGALLTTKDASTLTTSAGLAQAKGEPYDQARIELLDKLVTALLQEVFPARPERTLSVKAFHEISFFDSYFSNFIEGTRFEVEEAREVIEENKIIPGRSDDSHDILGTYEICSDRSNMSKVPADGSELIDLLKQRHAVILRGRLALSPGQFKEKLNRAGDTVFVVPEKVKGTLKAGYELITPLHEPFARAAYMMFLVSEVHPFADGNGRIARIMMNAELIKTKQTRIIIPTVYREDYLLTLRKLTRQHRPETFIRMLQRAHAWTHWLEPVSFQRLHEQMNESNAYRETGAVLKWTE
jgi:hypothetical protein